MAEPRPDLAARAARRVLEELEIIDSEGIRDLEQLCRGRGAVVTFQPLKGFEGLMLRQRRLIAVRDDIGEVGRTRFTIAHELGHWEMHPGLDQIKMCTAENLYAYRGSAEEIEANTFAAELLMPDFLMTDRMRYLSPTIDTVKRLAEHFQTSLTASAVRMCQYTCLPVFVAFSSQGRLRWYRRSPKAEPYFFLKLGSELHGESLARYCTASPDDPSAPEEVDAEAWFPTDFARSRFKVLEESVELGSYGITLSIITVDD